MRQGQYLDFETLRAEAEKAVEKSGKTQRELAATLGRGESALSQAIRYSGARYARLQREIIALLTDYEVATEPTFKVARKAT